jgi:2-hydroxychromene-2-carboxylate isomerase
MRALTFYFDFVSPFSYIGLHRLQEVPDVEIAYRPVLFAGLLNRWGQKGPAEIAAKRRWTYRWCHWWAGSLGIAFRFPAEHPFNPLPHLRLCIAAGSTREATGTIFDSIWTTGASATDPARFSGLLNELNVPREALQTAEVKDTLRENTAGAAARGVFGVPTFEIDGELFWGADALEFVRAFLADPSVVRNEEMRRIDGLPVGAARKT